MMVGKRRMNLIAPRHLYIDRKRSVCYSIIYFSFFEISVDGVFIVFYFTLAFLAFSFRCIVSVSVNLWISGDRVERGCLQIYNSQLPFFSKNILTFDSPPSGSFRKQLLF